MSIWRQLLKINLKTYKKNKIIKENNMKEIANFTKKTKDPQELKLKLNISKNKKKS